MSFFRLICHSFDFELSRDIFPPLLQMATWETFKAIHGDGYSSTTSSTTSNSNSARKTPPEHVPSPAAITLGVDYDSDKEFRYASPEYSDDNEDAIMGFTEPGSRHGSPLANPAINISARPEEIMNNFLHVLQDRNQAGLVDLTELTSAGNLFGDQGDVTCNFSYFNALSCFQAWTK